MSIDPNLQRPNVETQTPPDGMPQIPGVLDLSELDPAAPVPTTLLPAADGTHADTLEEIPGGPNTSFTPLELPAQPNANHNSASDAQERSSHRGIVAGVSAIILAATATVGVYLGTKGEDASSDSQTNPTPKASAPANPGSAATTPTTSASAEVSPQASPTTIPESSVSTEGFKVDYEGAGQLNTTERVAGVSTFEYTPSMGTGEALTFSEIPDPAKYPLQAMEATWAIIDAAESEPDDAKAAALLAHVAPKGSSVFKRIWKDRVVIQDWFKAQKINGVVVTADTAEHPVDVVYNAEKQVVKLDANTGQGAQRFILRFPDGKKAHHYAADKFGYGAQLTGETVKGYVDTAVFGYKLVSGKYQLVTYYVNTPYEKQ